MANGLSYFETKRLDRICYKKSSKWKTKSIEIIGKNSLGRESDYVNSWGKKFELFHSDHYGLFAEFEFAEKVPTKLISPKEFSEFVVTPD
jgi:hypothetical protein